MVDGSVRQTGRGKPRMVIVGLMAAALVATACSSSSKKGVSSSANNTGATAANDVLGTPKAATGTPVSIGFVTDAKGTSVDNSSEIPAAQAAVKYANAYLGGIGGHPIKLDICDDKQTPSGTSDCDNQLITDKVPIVLNNVLSFGDEL